MSDRNIPNEQQVSAYPSVNVPGQPIQHGLTKRELFAAMAMQALCTSTSEDEPSDTWDMDVLAQSAVSAADALLTALDVSEKNT